MVPGQVYYSDASEKVIKLLADTNCIADAQIGPHHLITHEPLGYRDVFHTDGHLSHAMNNNVTSDWSCIRKHAERILQVLANDRHAFGYDDEKHELLTKEYQELLRFLDAIRPQQ